jgi:phosphocarrier protein FPr
VGLINPLLDDGVLVLWIWAVRCSAPRRQLIAPPEMKDHIRFCGAPLVEGAIAAAVQIGLNSDLDSVCREASAALAPKQEQLGEAPADAATPTVGPLEASESIILTLTNLHGLHARPAAKFVRAAASHQAEVTVTDLTNGKGPVSARSLNAIATLGAVENHQIRIDASGPEAVKALDALRALIMANFGEAPAGVPRRVEKPVPIPPAPAGGSTLGAIPVSEGIAIGPIFRYQHPPPIERIQ